MPATWITNGFVWGTLLLDPYSILFTIPSPTTEDERVRVDFHQSQSALNSKANQFSKTKFDALITAQENEIGLSIGAQNDQQTFFVPLEAAELTIKYEQQAPIIQLFHENGYVHWSDDQWQTGLGIPVQNGHTSFHFGQSTLQFSLDATSDEWTLNEPLKLPFYWQYCESRTQWQAFTLAAFCQQDELGLRLSGGSLAYGQQDWETKLIYQQTALQSQGNWQLDDSLIAQSTVDSRLEETTFLLTYQDARLLYRYRDFLFGAFSDLDVNDDLISAVGKGQYLINLRAQGRQHSLTLDTLSFNFLSGDWRAPISLTLLKGVTAQGQLYEPLLFLGLPVLTEQETMTLNSGTLAGIQLQGRWQSGFWQTHLRASQIIPLRIDLDNSESDITESNSSKSSDPNTKKAGLLWPGFSVSLLFSANF